MALDLERDGVTVPDIDDPGVLARALQYLGTACRERPHERTAVLVTAVFGPHGADYCGLEGVQFTTFAPLGLVPFRFSQAELSCAAAQPAHRTASCSSGPRNSGRPSALPSSCSSARSGCGMSPTTLPAALLMPAMSAVLSSGLCPAE